MGPIPIVSLQYPLSEFNNTESRFSCFTEELTLSFPTLYPLPRPFSPSFLVQSQSFNYLHLNLTSPLSSLLSPISNLLFPWLSLSSQPLTPHPHPSPLATPLSVAQPPRPATTRPASPPPLSASTASRRPPRSMSLVLRVDLSMSLFSPPSPSPLPGSTR